MATDSDVLPSYDTGHTLLDPSTIREPPSAHEVHEATTNVQNPQPTEGTEEEQAAAAAAAEQINYLDDTVYLFFLENLKRHVCNLCVTYDFKYYRHYISKSVVVKDLKRCVRPDVIDNFEQIDGRLQYCPGIKYSTPKDKLYITILPDAVCHIDTALVGGIFEVLQTPVVCYAVNGTLLHGLFKQHNVVSTTGASFSQEFSNPCIADIHKCTYPNSILYATNINNAEWSLFYHQDDSRPLLFNSPKLYPKA